MRQGDLFQTSVYFLNMLNMTQKTSGLQLNFSIFQSPAIWDTIKTNCIEL